MKSLRYFIQFFFLTLLLLFFKIIGLKLSRILASKLFVKLGPIFKSQLIINKNIKIAFPHKDQEFCNLINIKMWETYGKIFAEYIFLKDFRKSNLDKYFEIRGQENLEKIKQLKKPVVFISGHFDNFELMAMFIERSGINLAAIYRPLNNYFLNPFMEKIRKKYICSRQIKKGISGTKDLLKHFRSKTSIALMIDQRVSQGIKSSLFGKVALTTTIPAQFVKKYKCEIVPIYIERKKNNNFILEIMKPINFNKDQNTEEITLILNQLLEKMILRNPYQWIWTHNRWK